MAATKHPKTQEKPPKPPKLSEVVAQALEAQRQRLNERFLSHLARVEQRHSAELQALMEARARTYTDGTVEKGQCGALCPRPKGHKGAWPKIACRREQHHPLGLYDRHKAVYGDPHIAVSWND